MSLAALERAKLLSSASTPEDKRQYLEHLLTLPAYRDPQLTTYFAEHVSLHFADVLDLQDQAVDAVLDLCEDDNEKTRITGIQALARIGKVEPRWVKGNTGVLLQLLESPPSELKHVRQALYDLMDISPSDVFSMMAEDCKGSEDETGASRRNILDFLVAAKDKRSEILESGDHIDAECVFADGFYEVMATTAIAETRQILGLLLPLSTISGRRATSESTGKFAKTLTKCPHPDSSPGLASPLVRLWIDLDKRHRWMDPGWTLYFLADHGAAVVSLMADKEDKQAKELLLFPTRDPSKLRKSLEYMSAPELDQEKLLPSFASTMVKSALRLMDQKRPPQILEVVLYSLYSVITISRYTRDVITKTQSRQLLDLERQADRRKRDAKTDDEVQVWRNVRDMAEVMGDKDLRPFYIRPTWESVRDPDKPKERVEPSKSNVESLRRPEQVSTAKQPRAVVVDSVAKSSAPNPDIRAQPEVSTSTDKAAPMTASSVPSSHSTLAQTKPAPNQTTTPAPSTPELSILARSKATPVPPNSNAPTSAPSFSILARSTKSNVTPSAPTASTPTLSSGFSILARSKQPPAGPSAPPTVPVQPTNTTTPSPTVSSGFSIRAHATNAINYSGSPSAVAIAQTQASPQKPSPGLSIRSATPNSVGNATPQPGSLLSRIGSSTSSGGGNKRPREEPTAVATTGIDSPIVRSLADRLRNPSEPKKARQAPAQSPRSVSTPTPTSTPPNTNFNTVGGNVPSLLSRMSSGSLTQASQSSGNLRQHPGANNGIALKRNGTPPIPRLQTPMSITGRASPNLSHQPRTNPVSTSARAQNMSADGGSDEGVVRKGRGFAQQDQVPALGFGQRGSWGRKLL